MVGRERTPLVGNQLGFVLGVDRWAPNMGSQIVELDLVPAFLIKAFGFVNWRDRMRPVQ